MTKASGLGEAFYLSGYDISGDVGSLSGVQGGPALLDVTGIDKFAPERIGGTHDGELSFNAYYNVAALAEHSILKTLPTTDVRAMWVAEVPAIGAQAACLSGKQVNYDWARGTDGSLVATVQVTGSGDGLEWCDMYTAGKRTDGAPTTGASIDFGSVSTLFGMSAYLHVFTVTGTSVTVTVEDSADNISFAAITGLGFSAVAPGGAPQGQRLETGATATIRRYVRATTTGTFSNAVFAVAAIRHLSATL